MGRRARDDRGVIAAEAGLLYAGVAVIIVPIVFALGLAVKSVFSDAGDRVQEQRGLSAPQQPGPNPSDPVVVATAQLQTDLEAQIAGGPTVTCATLPEVQPPAGTTTNCSAVFPDGSVQQVLVTWTGGGSYQVSVS